MSTDQSGLIATVRNANNAAEIAELRAENSRLRATVEAVEKLADEWSGGGAEQGQQHIMNCTAHHCSRCVIVEAAMDLRAAVGAHTHEWVKMPNLRVDVCVQCGVERVHSAAAVQATEARP